MGHRYESILETIGRTPVVRLGKLAPDGRVETLAGFAQATMTLHVTMVTDEPVEALLQQQLLFGKGKVHTLSR